MEPVEMEDAGARLARLANQQKLYEDALVAEWARAQELAVARRDATLQYILGLLHRLVASFNRSAEPGLEVTLKVDAGTIYFARNYTTLLVIGFEEDAVTVHSAPRARPLIDKRMLCTPGVGGSMDLVDAERSDAMAGSAESFAEGVLMLALGLYP